MAGKLGRGLRLALSLIAIVSVAACASVYRNHGYVPPEDELQKITVGVDTRDTVAETIGRPSTEGVLRDRAWYYVGSRFRHFGMRAPEEVDRQVVAISFDAEGRVANIERFTLADGRVITLSRRVTESNIKGISFIRQLLGNIGRFDVGQALGG
ncbi:MAG: outer membrane protein assembly factor BamE [Alphaproteobacteria bacterium]|nr:MAG: outer membrane protein assembly factor BamE [Alphaproteobacteria bacterium]